MVEYWPQGGEKLRSFLLLRPEVARMIMYVYDVWRNYMFMYNTLLFFCVYLAVFTGMMLIPDVFCLRIRLLRMKFRHTPKV